MHPTDPVIRFLAKVSPEPNCGCWLWTGAVTNSGYGKIGMPKGIGERATTVEAHRFAYHHYRGDVPKGYFVCHRCDVPTCVNPDHLFLGTPKENTADMVRKNRANHSIKARGADNALSKLTEADVRLIRSAKRRTNEFAARFNVSRSAIQAVRRGITWRHVQ